MTKETKKTKKKTTKKVVEKKEKKPTTKKVEKEIVQEEKVVVAPTEEKTSIFDAISFDILERIAMFLLMIWCINSPIEYVMQNYLDMDGENFIKILISLIGAFGICIYLLYKFKLYSKKKYTFKEKLKDNIPIILIGLLFIWACISTIFAEDKAIAIFGENYRNEGLIVYFEYIGILLLASIISNKKYLNYLLKTFLVSSLIVITLPLLNKVTFNKVFDYTYSSVFHQFNHYGYYLMLAACIAMFNFIKSNTKLTNIIGIIIYAYINYFLIINNTFGVYLALLLTIISLLVYSLITKWNRLKVILIIIVFILLSIVTYDKNGYNIAGDNLSDFFNDIKTIFKYETTDNKESMHQEIGNVGTSRGNLWRGAFNYTMEHPIFGGGIESLGTYYKENKIDYSQDRPHDIFLQISSFIGIPGAILYLILILYVGISNIKKLKFKNIAQITVFFTGLCYFLSSIVGNTMYYTSPYFMILLGMLIYYTRNKITIKE